VTRPAGFEMPAGAAGLGFKPEHFEAVRHAPPRVGFWEVHAENYMVAGGPMLHMLAYLRERYPVTLHGVGLSIGGEEPLDSNHLSRLADLVRRYEPAFFSEHLAWSSHGGIYTNDLLPLPYRADTLQRICDHVDQVQNRLGRPLLLENPSTYVRFNTSTLSEGEFLSAIVRQTGCGLLLDVNNLYVSAVNHGEDPEHALNEFPLHATAQIHLAGHAVATDRDGEPLLIDDHGSAVAEPVWALYRSVIRRVGAIPTLIERDQHVPALDVLVAEAHCAQQWMADTVQEVLS
jgi:uncharacterized protein